MGRDEMTAIARMIDRGVSAAREGDEAALATLADEVRELTAAFPAPGIDA
jgi:glycine hydroxymethyltransferase